MKNWKKAIGFLITGILAILGFVFVGFFEGAPSWLDTALPIITAVCNVLGIVFINPFQQAQRDRLGLNGDLKVL